MRSRFLVLLVGLIPSLAFSQELLTLDEAIRIGLENSYSIQISQNNVEIAKNNNTIGNAGYLPRVDWNLNQSNNFQNRSYEFDDESTSSQKGYATYGLTSGAVLNWTVFDGFSMFMRKEKLGLYEQQSDLSLRITVENTVADIAYTYYNIALNEKLYKMYEEQMDLSRQRLKIAREKSLIGVGYELQELQSEVDFRADSAQYLLQASYLINLKAELNRLLVREPNHGFSVNTDIPVPAIATCSDVFLKISEFNPSLLIARLQSTISDLEVNEAVSSRYPTVNLTGAYNFSHTGTPDGTTRLSTIHGPTLGIGASISLFNGFNATRRINNARIFAENQKLNEKDLTLRLQSTAFKLVNNLNQAIELVKVEEKSVLLAQRNAEASWEKYRLGAISDLELRESQKKFLEAQTRLISAQMNAQAAEIDILSLTGEMGDFISK
ncbi:MAG: TolC family protein [Tenuifilaceae bacterium]|jgi:outer membrane protein TolC|nr:TolC family protein [Tenuifilaceae bacterium]